MSVTLDYTSVPFTRSEKIKSLRWRLWQQEIQTALHWGLAQYAFGVSLESGSRFCVGTSGRNLASVAVNMFWHLIEAYLTNTFCKFCTFNAICKDNAEVKNTTVQHKKVHSRQRWQQESYHFWTDEKSNILLREENKLQRRLRWTNHVARMLQTRMHIENGR
jgi:hypothetical protein